MGNITSNSNTRRRNSTRRNNATTNTNTNTNNNHNTVNNNNTNPPQPEIIGNRYVFAAATPYPPPTTQQNQYPNPGYYQQYPGYYPPQPPPMPMPAPYNPNYPPPYAPPPPIMLQGPAQPYVEHQKAVTIRNDVNLKKESLRIEPDEENPGKFLVAFTFDATVNGSITIIFFAKEGENCCLTSTKEELHPPLTVNFEQGLAQKFKQQAGTGIDFSMFEEAELVKDSGMDVYPLAVKAEAAGTENQENGSSNSQITQAVFEKDKGEYKVRVVKQILWVNGMRYELQEIFGIGNSTEDGEVDNTDPGKECVICLSEPRDTTVLPCRHMCMCSECAKVLRFQTNRCPICRQPVERLLEIKVSNSNDE